MPSLPQPPSPPPPRRDIPKPDNMTFERYAAYLKYLADAPPDVWRDTDGTLYVNWIPTEVYTSTRSLVTAGTGLRPGNPDYGRFLDDLLPHFDYAGRKVPHAAGAHHDAAAG